MEVYLKDALNLHLADMQIKTECEKMADYHNGTFSFIFHSSLVSYVCKNLLYQRQTFWYKYMFLKLYFPKFECIFK